jgi:predicted HTH domain antitoxin
MKTVTLNLPDSVSLPTHEIVQFIAAKLYETGELSLGQGAKLAGMTLIAFAESLAKYNVSLINYPASEIKHDAEII